MTQASPSTPPQHKPPCWRSCDPGALDWWHPCCCGALADGLLMHPGNAPGAAAHCGALAAGGLWARAVPHSDIDVLVLLPDGPVLERTGHGARAGRGLHPQLLGHPGWRSAPACARGRMPERAANDVTVQTSLLKPGAFAATRAVCQFEHQFGAQLDPHAFWCQDAGDAPAPHQIYENTPTRWSPTARNRPAACATCR